MGSASVITRVCCEAVPSAILVTAWLLVLFFNQLTNLTFYKHHSWLLWNHLKHIGLGCLVKVSSFQYWLSVNIAGLILVCTMSVATSTDGTRWPDSVCKQWWYNQCRWQPSDYTRQTSTTGFSVSSDIFSSTIRDINRHLSMFCTFLHCLRPNLVVRYGNAAYVKPTCIFSTVPQAFCLSVS